MDIRKTKIAILLIFMVVGQMSEIDFQRVDYNGKIKQYAIVEEVGDSVFRYPCPDCACYLTMTDPDGFVIKNSELSTNEGDGLFTNILYEDNLHTTQTYQLKHLCISPTYGNGTVISSLKISTEETSIDFSASADEVTEQIESVTSTECERADPDSWVPDVGYYTCLLWKSMSGLYKPLVDIERAISGVIEDGGAFRTGFDAGTAPIRYAFNTITGLYNDPSGTVYGIFLSFMGMLGGILSAFGMGILVFEMYIVFKTIGNPSGIGMVADFIEENLKAFSWIFEKMMKVLMFMANLIPGT